MLSKGRLCWSQGQKQWIDSVVFERVDCTRAASPPERNLGYSLSIDSVLLERVEFARQIHGYCYRPGPTPVATHWAQSSTGQQWQWSNYQMERFDWLILLHVESKYSVTSINNY